MAEYLIWSFEHNAWWAPGMRGYVSDAKQAGRYRLNDAEGICIMANIIGINEAIVPLPGIQPTTSALPTGIKGHRR